MKGGIFYLLNGSRFFKKSRAPLGGAPARVYFHRDLKAPRKQLLIFFLVRFMLLFSPFLLGQLFTVFHLKQNALEPFEAEF